MEYLVLKSDVFLWHNDRQYLVYNSTNGMHCVGKLTHDLIQIMERLDDLSRLYNIGLPDLWDTQPIGCLVHDVLRIDAGSVFECSDDRQCPATLKPVLKIQNDISYVAKTQDVNTVIESIQSITIHMGGETRLPERLREIHDQTLFPIYGSECIDVDSIKALLSVFPNGDHLVVRVLEYARNQNDFLLWLKEKGFTVNVILWVNDLIMDSVIGDAESLIASDISVDATFYIEDLSVESVGKLVDKNIRLRLIIDDPRQLNVLERLGHLPNDTLVLPWLDDKNLEPFKPLMKIDDGYFNDAVLSKKDIFIRSVMNVNYYGQIEILPSGAVMDAIGFNEIGNVKSFVLTDLLKLYSSESAWFQTRSKTPCRSCIYHHICIPPSRYENTLNHYGFCDKNKEQFNFMR